MGYPGYVGAASGLGPCGRLPDRRVRGSGPRLRERYPAAHSGGLKAWDLPLPFPLGTLRRGGCPHRWPGPRACHCHCQSSLSTVHSNLPSGMASAQQAGLVIPVIVMGPPWSMVCSVGEKPLTMHPTTPEQPTTGKTADGEGAARGARVSGGRLVNCRRWRLTVSLEEAEDNQRNAPGAGLSLKAKAAVRPGARSSKAAGMRDSRNSDGQQKQVQRMQTQTRSANGRATQESAAAR